MTFSMHSIRDLRHSTLSLILLVAFAGVAGCGTDNSPDVMVSPPGWVVVPSGGQHAKSATRDYISDNGSIPCTECHGADLSGGNSKVSCFGNPAGCHHGPVSGWIAASPAAQNHGVSAKQAPGSSSFVSCQICHGSNFSGGGAKVSCFPCHGANAPHPARPWHGPTYTHIDTNTENAQVCAQCHFPGSPNNPSSHPATPAAAGTPPGCFNSTLCHGDTAAPHAVGTGWRDPNPQFHGLTAKQNLSLCQGCHGAPGTTLFNGGTAPTSCQSSTCHPQAKAHPGGTVRWYQAPQPFPGYVPSHRDSGNRGAACAICHKVEGAGTGPDPGAPSCFSASFNGVTCHSGGPGGVNHSVPFQGATHTTADQARFDTDCSACHAVTGISPNSTAPSCTVCHRSATALPFTNCTSCHARPPSGTAYPNIAGRHARHDALVNVTGVCTPCHNNIDSGTIGHYNRANARPGKDALRVSPGDVAFLAVYNAKAAAAAFDNAALTCANVSCHGGVTTPNWQTGSIEGNTDAGCRQCHKIGTAAGTPENNSPFSGLHTVHLSTTVGGAILCIECHNMSNGKAGALNHYKFLDTPQMEGPAKDTLAPNGSEANYNAANQTCGTFTCHTIVHVNFSWSGGTSHSVPFTGANHTSVTSSNFATNCGSCHFETGSASNIGPTCTVCHQTGSPLTSLACTSCHGDPPSGASYPNAAGKHAVHGALPGVGICTPCHNGLDTGTLEHYNRANARTGKNALRVPPGDIAFLTAYNAKSGPASFNATTRTCSNVICHGGQATPDWQTATANAIDVPNACLNCHGSGTAQYNSYFSGDHNRHIVLFGLSATTCKRCHDVSKVTVSGHFQNLATPAFEQPASQTVLPAVGYNGKTCNPQAGGLTGCHGSKKW
jgi:predicted CxxxxCH...CXXCH cytochrome family protein